MTRLLFVLAIAALALAAPALGKGPSAATIDGAGGGGKLTFTGCCSPESATMILAEQAGFFAATFGRQPDPTLAKRPKGNLGPRYTITYTVPGPSNEVDKLRQDLYPYASRGPVTYMRPGQRFFETQRTRGGWFQATPQLKATLVAAGLPARLPTGGSDGRSLPSSVAVPLVALLGVAVFLVLRRLRPAARMAGSTG